MWRRNGCWFFLFGIIYHKIPFRQIISGNWTRQTIGHIRIWNAPWTRPNVIQCGIRDFLHIFRWICGLMKLLSFGKYKHLKHRATYQGTTQKESLYQRCSLHLSLHTGRCTAHTNYLSTWSTSFQICGTVILFRIAQMILIWFESFNIFHSRFVSFLFEFHTIFHIESF